MYEDGDHSSSSEEEKIENFPAGLNKKDANNSWEEDSSSDSSVEEEEDHDSENEKATSDKNSSIEVTPTSQEKKDINHLVEHNDSHSESNSGGASDAVDDNDVDHGKTIKKERSKSEQKIWEENPDIYGIRRSSRTRKEPVRLVIQSESDSDDSVHKRSRKHKRKRGQGWIPTLSDSESEDSDSSFDTPARRPQRRKPKATSVRKQRGRNASSSSSDFGKSGNSSKAQYSGLRRNNVNKVSYKEESENDTTDSGDIIDNEDGAGEFAAEDVETIQKVMRHRMGRVGETGAQTTMYAVEVEEIAAKGEPDPNTEETEKQYLIKWKDWANLHNTWESKESLITQKCNGMKKFENYMKRIDEIDKWKKTSTPEDVEYFEYQIEINEEIKTQYQKVERIIAHQFTADSTSSYPDYYCKWHGLAYSDCSWEDGALIARFFQSEIDAYLERERSDLIPVKNAKCLRNRPKFVALKTQPTFLGNDELQLRDYQLDGVNWLVHAWTREISVILADEMGLGKTIQAISFLSCLFFSHSLYGPFLLVVPLSTIDAWQREFQLWCPEMNVIVYIGDVNSRTQVREHEWYLNKSKKIKFSALITTYEILLRDKDLLGSLYWACLIVDEAHRLKNEDSLLYRILIEFHTNFRLLITGTPLQNSLKELWSLLHFIMPRTFEDWNHFDSQYSVSDKDGLQQLHQDLELYLIRRVKKDVEKSLPPKVEQILRVEMSQVQKQYYKLILTKNVAELCKELKGSFSGLLNIIVELKKCCNHSNLIKPFEPGFEDPNYLQILIKGSGKMILLDKLLCQLKGTGHRVLIFSQMVRLLDIIADYLYLKKFQFQRLDGSIKGETRQRALDHFNAEGSQDFCFLLSTRAGGLGINLASADTVIIFDSDWNPQNDLQAMARAHRIGQKNKVSIYRFVTRCTIEEEIIERAKKKMVLDHLIIQRMDTTGRRILSKSNYTPSSNTPFNKEELSSILKFGAEELFKDNNQDSDQKLQAMDIDEILKQAETEDTQENSLGQDFLSQFKVVNYAAFEEETNDEKPTAIQRLWEEIIPEEDRKKVEDDLKEEKEAELMLQPRNRKTVEKQKIKVKSKAIVDTDLSSSSESDGLDDDDGEMSKSKKNQKMKIGNKALKKDGVKGFTDSEIRRFVKSYKKFARPMTRLDSIAENAELMEKSAAELLEVGELLKTSCEQAVKEYQEKLLQDELFDGKKKGATIKISGVTVNAPSVLKSVIDLEPLAVAIPNERKEQLSYRLTVPTRNVHWGITWGVVEDSMLLLGMLVYGVGNWDAIKNDPKLQLTSKILPIGDGKPQDKHLQSRADYLLKLLKEQCNDQQKLTNKKKKLIPDQKTSKHATETLKTPPEEKAQTTSVTEEEKVSKKRKPKLTDKALKKEKKKIKKNVKPKVTPDDGQASVVAPVEEVNLDEATFRKCKEKMRAERKSLQSLQTPDDALSEKEQVQNTKRCLLKIGDHIEKCLDDYNNNPQDLDTWRNNLWSFVAKFTEFGPSKLHKLYRTACRKRDALRDEQKREIQKLKESYSNSLHEMGKHLLPPDRLELEEARKRTLGISSNSPSTKIPKLDSIKIPHKKKENLATDNYRINYGDQISYGDSSISLDDEYSRDHSRRKQKNQPSENRNFYRHGKHEQHLEYRISSRKITDEHFDRHSCNTNEDNIGGKIQTYREWKECQGRHIQADEKPPNNEVSLGFSKKAYRDKQFHGDEKNIRKNGSGNLVDPRAKQRAYIDRHDIDKDTGLEYSYSPSVLKSPATNVTQTEPWSRKRTLSNNSDNSVQSSIKQTVTDLEHSPNSNQSWTTMSGGNT